MVPQIGLGGESLGGTQLILFIETLPAVTQQGPSCSFLYQVRIKFLYSIGVGS
eukprot:SAG31_NODE_2682_length_5257_cov_9.066693_1_plen_53_part_00